MSDLTSRTRCPLRVPAHADGTSDHRPTISFELYPPRSAAGSDSLWLTIAELARAEPDFFSVTYGASGSSRETSREVLRWIVAHTDVPVVAHLTCLGAPRAEVRAVAEGLIADGVRDFLALRGDPPADVTGWEPHPEGLQRASELVSLLRELETGHPGRALTVAVAANPWALRQAPAGDCGDLRALLAKQDAGADYAITQVFFEVEDYTRYLEAARDAGVTIPLLPGIVPLHSPTRLRRLEEISGVEVPPSILALLDAEDDDEARRSVGTTLGSELVEQVLAAGAPGVHLYTFNQHRGALDLLEGARLRTRARPDPTRVAG